MHRQQFVHRFQPHSPVLLRDNHPEEMLLAGNPASSMGFS
jgi:hypothetical protein